MHAKISKSEISLSKLTLKLIYNWILPLPLPDPTWQMGQVGYSWSVYHSEQTGILMLTVFTE